MALAKIVYPDESDAAQAYQLNYDYSRRSQNFSKQAPHSPRERASFEAIAESYRGKANKVLAGILIKKDSLAR